MSKQYANTVFYTDHSFKNKNTVGCIFHTTEDENEAERINQHAREANPVNEDGTVSRLHFVHKYVDGVKTW